MYMCIYLSLCHISVITNMMAVFVNCTQSSLHMHVCLYLIVDKPVVVWLFYDLSIIFHINNGQYFVNL